METDGLGGDDVHERAALDAGEGLGINFLGVFLLAEDQAAARSAQRLVRGGGDKVGVFDGAGMQAGGDQPGDVRDVGQQPGPDFPRDFTHALEINDARIGAGADGDHARTVLPRHFGQLIVINQLVLLAHAVVDDFKEAAGEIGLVAVGEVAAVAKGPWSAFCRRA